MQEDSECTRVETDSLGTMLIDESRYWGAQTERSRRNFPIGEEHLPLSLVHALGMVKHAACQVNRDMGLLESSPANAILQASREVMEGKLDAHFPLSVWQTGSGTHSNMNANEVIANRANELLGHARGDMFPVHPNDHVNMSQSSNDTFPTAIHLAAALMIEQQLLPAGRSFAGALHAKADAWRGIIKTGRTHLQDATPLSLGQEFSGYAAQIDAGVQGILNCLPAIHEITQGGTAVGTGLNTRPGFDTRIAARLAELTGQPFFTVQNKFAAQAAHDALVQLHGAVTTLAMACFKIANDIRYLASGPRAGLGELSLPVNEPGSSIMAGKVNPTQCEALTQVCVQIHGNNSTMSFAGSQGQFELNAYKPLMAHALLQSINLLADAMASFTTRCVVGIEPRRDTIARHLSESLMLVTALVPVIGYDKAASIAKAAHANKSTLREEVLRSGNLSEEEADRLLDPKAMIGPG